MHVSIGNWGANQLRYKILDKLIKILEKTNNKLHRTSLIMVKWLDLSFLKKRKEESHTLKELSFDSSQEMV